MQDKDKEAAIANKIAELRRRHHATSSPVLIHLYVLNSRAMYQNCLALQKRIARYWEIGTLEIPRDLPAYHVVCPVCGQIVGSIDLLKQHKLLRGRCHCAKEFLQDRWPIIDDYALQELAKALGQSADAVEHFICEALIERSKHGDKLLDSAREQEAISKGLLPWLY